MKRTWKYIKIGLIVFLTLIITVPSILYISAIDWSKKHTQRVNSLPEFSPSVDHGEFRLKANGLEFLTRVSGMQNEGQGVIMLHGFPESSIVWKPFMDKAAARGYQVIAFDQRGYSPNARPEGVNRYVIDSLVADVIAVADRVGFHTFHLVGHDWGSGIGWKTVMDHPDRIHTWTAMAVPHIGVFFEGVMNDPEQQKRSDYMNKLRMPILPELFIQLFKNRIFKGLEEVWQPHEIAEYKAIHSEHGVSNAALNYYRAMDYENTALQNSLNQNVYVPTLFLWGKNDPIVSDYVIKNQPQYMKGPFQSIELDAGHSLMQERTEEVIDAVIGHWNDNQNLEIE